MHGIMVSYQKVMQDAVRVCPFAKCEMKKMKIDWGASGRLQRGVQPADRGVDYRIST